MRTLPVLLIILLTLRADAAHSQSSTGPDSLQHKTSLLPAFDFDQRFSFIKDQPVNIWGQRAGILVNERFKIGVGGYFLDQRLKDVYSTSYYERRRLFFGTFYFEPFLIRKTYWEVSILTEIGFGRSYDKVYEATSNQLDSNRVQDFFPTGAGLSLSFKLPAFFGWRPFRWFGINFLAGYRYDLAESRFGTHYNGMFWSISGAIFLDRITSDVRYWKKLKRERKGEHPTSFEF